MFKSILFPIDGSPESRNAAEFVVDLVKTHQSSLTIVSVVEPAGAEAGSGAGSPSHEMIQQLLQGAHDLFAKAGIEAETIEREGKPSFVICDVADEIEADLIVMGSSGATPEGAAESVTGRVIGFSPCPVLVVP